MLVAVLVIFVLCWTSIMLLFFHKQYVLCSLNPLYQVITYTQYCFGCGSSLMSTVVHISSSTTWHQSKYLSCNNESKSNISV